MSLLIDCPLPTSIEDLSQLACPEHWGQIVRVGFQRLGTPFTDISLETEWDTKLAAVDDTKVQLSTFCENVVIPPGEPITEGGDDNTTLFGQSVIVGQGQVQVSGTFRGLTAELLKELKAYISEGQVYGNLGVYLVNEHGQVISWDDDGAAAPAGSAIPISSWFISDNSSEGFNTHNKANFVWNFKAGFSENIRVTSLTWDILLK